MYAGVGMFVFDHFLRYISLSLSLHMSKSKRPSRSLVAIRIQSNENEQNLSELEPNCPIIIIKK